MEHFATTVALIGIVIVVASLLSAAAERSGVPLVAAFLVLGAALGPWGLGVADVGFDSPALRVLATLALALVLFSDAVTLDTATLRARRGLLWRIVGPGTLGPAILMSAAGWLLLDLPILAAAILGAALASTDPVLLRSVVRSRAVPETTRVALRIEAGMNDVVLLPIVVLAILFLRAGGDAAPIAGREIARSIVGLFVLGPALGAAVGWVGISLLATVRSRIGVRRDYESLYALGLAFSAYAAAESVGGSGFVAAFAAGFMVAARDVELCDCFLEYGEASAEMFLLLTFVALGTTLIWTGLEVVDLPTLAFAIIALTVRTAVLYPMLAGTGIDTRERWLIALFGPRGLSSLLLVVLAVFAGIPGAERLFSIACLVVLLSVFIHGTAIALFLRRHAGPSRVPAPAATVATAAASDDDLRISIDELRDLQARAEPVTIVDARADRSYDADPRQAVGAVRVNPEDPVRDATEQRLSQRSTLVVYCA